MKYLAGFLVGVVLAELSVPLLGMLIQRNKLIRYPYYVGGALRGG